MKSLAPAPICSSFAVLIVVGVLVSACGVNTHLPRNTQTVGGLTIELGVMPAELIRGHITTLGDPYALHGGTPSNSSSHHVVVALFDAKSGARITDARVRAGVSDHSYNYPADTPLEPMELNGAMSYGNFFLMQGEGLWRIHLDILRPGMARPLEVDFGYENTSA